MALAFFAYWWRFDPERRILLAAVGVKLLSSLVNGLINIYLYEGFRDALYYHEIGIDYADMLRSDLVRGTDKYFSADWFFWLNGISTTRFETLCGLMHFLLFDSFLACSFFCSLAALVGQVYLYRVFIAHYPDPQLRRWWQVSILFFPTLVFWSSGLLKDTLGIYGLGCTFWGAHCLMERRSYRGLALTLFGAYVLLLFRAQILPVLSLALLARLLVPQRQQADSTTRQLSGFQRFLLLACSVVGIGVVMLVESRFSLSELPQTIEDQQRRGAEVSLANASAGSTQERSEIGTSSWLGLLVSAPWSLITTLYRPFLWEASGASALLGALENLALVILTVHALLRFVQSGADFRRLLREPLVPTCLVFVLLFGVAIGAATLNLGTISRYRIPLIPFFAALLLIVESHARHFRSQPASRVRKAVSLSPPPSNPSSWRPTRSTAAPDSLHQHERPSPFPHRAWEP